MNWIFGLPETVSAEITDTETPDEPTDASGEEN